MNPMNEIKCAATDCPEVFRTSEPVALNAKFTCRNHTDSVKEEESFQESQFDRNLLQAHKPAETYHIKNQGSDLDDNHAPSRQDRKIR